MIFHFFFSCVHFNKFNVSLSAMGNFSMGSPSYKPAKKKITLRFYVPKGVYQLCQVLYLISRGHYIWTLTFPKSEINNLEKMFAEHLCWEFPTRNKICKDTLSYCTVYSYVNYHAIQIQFLAVVACLYTGTVTLCIWTLNPRCPWLSCRYDKFVSCCIAEIDCRICNVSHRL